MRVFGIAIVVGLVALFGTVSCQPLYSGKPAALRNPVKKKPPPEAEVKVAAIPWDDECTADFHAKAGGPLPQPAIARQISDQATNTLVAADRNPDPPKKASLILEAIEKYKTALGKDPFSAEATYGLALAYTKVLKKGCTLKLLKRLADLKNNPKYAPDATRMIDAAADQNAFKPFKKDAHSAMGI